MKYILIFFCFLAAISPNANAQNAQQANTQVANGSPERPPKISISDFSLKVDQFGLLLGKNNVSETLHALEQLQRMMQAAYMAVDEKIEEASVTDKKRYEEIISVQRKIYDKVNALKKKLPERQEELLPSLKEFANTIL